MILPGLVSVTFRELTIEQVIDLAVKSGLKGIEWGGDIHVPPQDLFRAQQVGRLTREAGLQIVSYGSYYRVGCDNQKATFEDILATAVHLGAPLIRVWAGDKGTQEADESWWNQVSEDSRRIAELAKQENIRISYEYHGGTLTDNVHSAIKLLKKANHHNLFCYWQPPVFESFEERLLGLKEISPWLSHIHTFHWDIRERRPLSEGQDMWRVYLKEAAALPGVRYAMLEFVMNGLPEQLIEDATVLRNLLEEIND
jgi:sugar phosphate isomerase/epimerase